MNIIQGTIKAIHQVDTLIILEINVGKHIFTSLVLENTNSHEYQIGDNVNVIFKEMEVMIATKDSKVSARNSFISPVIEFEIGESLCNITFSFDTYAINAIITKSAFIEFACKIGDSFQWFVKSNEVIIQKV